VAGDCRLSHVQGTPVFCNRWDFQHCASYASTRVFCQSPYFLVGNRTWGDKIHTTSEKTKMESVNHASGLVCSFDIRSVLLRDQLRLFRFITCLCRTVFPFSFFCALARAARTFSMVGPHSLKCFAFLSSDILYASRNWMIVSCASLSCLLSQVMFPSRPCDVDASRVFAANCCLSSLFSWYSSAIASCACFSYCDGS
jgi:hypothetical protein